MKENNFQQIEEHEAPDRIKSQVRGSLEFGRFAGGIVDLYLSKIGAIFSSMMRSFGNDKEQHRK